MTAPRPACRSGRWLATIAIWPTNVEVTRKRVTSWATERLSPEASATPATAMPASRAWSRTPARRTRRLSTSTTALNFACTSAESRATRRRTWAWPRLVRRSSRPAIPSSSTAAWSVHAISSTTLRREISPSSDRMANHVTPASTGKRMKDGHQVTPATSHIGRVPKKRAGEHPDLPPDEVADFVGVVVDPVEDLAHRLLAQRGQRLAQRRPEQVLAQPALRAVRAADPGDLAGGVDHGRTDEADREQPDQARGSGPRRAVPATTVPSVIPTAPTAEAASAAIATGLFSRRTSTLRDGSTAGGAGRCWSGGGGLGRDRSHGPTTLCGTGDGSLLVFARPRPARTKPDRPAAEPRSMRARTPAVGGVLEVRGLAAQARCSTRTRRRRTTATPAKPTPESTTPPASPVATWSRCQEEPAAGPAPAECCAVLPGRPPGGSVTNRAWAGAASARPAIPAVSAVAPAARCRRWRWMWMWTWCPPVWGWCSGG